MINRLLKITCALMFVVAAPSCELQDLYRDDIASKKAEIPIDIDWTKCGVDPQNVTVMFYDKATGDLVEEHTYEHNSKEIQSYAYLGSGTYRAVVFNELRDQIDYVSCVDHENISTLKFESNDDDPVRVRSNTRSYVKQPGDLAVAIVEDIVVTDDLLTESVGTKATIDDLMNVTPEKKNNTIKVTVHINGLNNSRMPALGDLINLSDGYYVESGKNSSTTSTLQFSMNNRIYDEDQAIDRNGTITATVKAFGTLDDRKSTSAHDDSTPIMLDILFMLIDKEKTEISREVDVTDLIVFSEQEDGSMLLTIDASIDEALPDVVPDGSTGDSGFSAEAEEWDRVDVPLNQ